MPSLRGQCPRRRLRLWLGGACACPSVCARVCAHLRRARHNAWRARDVCLTCAHAQGELLAKVPELQAANARWRHEVHTVQAQLDDARTLHSRQMAECEQQAAAAIESEREVLEREREQWKQYHQRHIEVEREERQRLEARVKMLEAQNARVQEQNAQLEKACASVRGAPAPWRAAPHPPACGRVGLRVPSRSLTTAVAAQMPRRGSWRKRLQKSRISRPR